MAQISIQNLTFSYDENSENIFENTNLSFDSNWKIGLIGRNGKGKTTLLKLLLGNYQFSGNIIKNSIHFDYFPFEVLNKNKLTIDLIADICPELELWKVMVKMNEINLEPKCLEQQFDTLSNGQQTKLLLAILFAKENNFLLIDEPTNHLDTDSRKCVEEFLNKQKGFIVVSHDRVFLDNCVDHIISLNRKGIEVQKGNFSTWWQNKQHQDNLEIAQNEKLEKDISRMQESMKQTKLWSDKVEKTKYGTRIAGLRPDRGAIGAKSAKMAKRSKVIERRQEKAIEEKSQLLKNIDTQEDLFLNTQKLNAEIFVELKNISLFYDNKQVVDNVSFVVQNGDKVAICGKNGSGKTSLLKFILGEDISHTGSIYKNGKLKISYVSQKYDWLCGSLFEFAKIHNIDCTKFLTMLRKLGFPKEQFEHDISSFSEGQKKKVLLAKSLCEDANLYIWDEPLNYIDIISRIQIEELIKISNITMIFVEHDSAFINNISTKIVNI